MAKSKPNKEVMMPKAQAIILGIVALIIGNYLGNWNNSIFVYNPPIEIAHELHWMLGWTCLLFGLSVLLNRKRLTYMDLGRMARTLGVLFLFFFGWRLTAAASNGQIQNDGFNVTGGFMMFFSGLYFGYFAKSGKINHGKK